MARPASTRGGGAPRLFALPGLVDSHSHVSLRAGSGGPVPVDITGAEATLERCADGVAIVRDVGGIPRVVLNLSTVPGQPRSNSPRSTLARGSQPSPDHVLLTDVWTGGQRVRDRGRSLPFAPAVSVAIPVGRPIP